MCRSVIGFVLLKVAEHGNHLVRGGSITSEQLADALKQKERSLSALSDTEIATQLLNDLPREAFVHC